MSTNDNNKRNLPDDIILNLSKESNKNDLKTTLVNPDKVKQVLLLYNTIKSLFSKDSKTKVTYELYKPYKNMGSVSIIGKTILFNNPIKFVELARLADNLEIYSKTNGEIQINFTFYGLSEPIE